ncbi:MAG: FtsW/RodA/SpoVE family cell cycle protein [Oscillospiraceae bacterium]|nr:FtsW/RodA/SpoVE family cell cycle protein [Oscillospiraceae bacterium]
MKKIWAALTGYVRATDKWLIFLWVGASAASVLFLYGLYTSDLASKSTVLKQVAAIAMGFVAAVVISLFDYHTLLKLWKLYMPLALLLVGLTFFIGTGTRTDEAWINIPLGPFSFSLQPSEVLKISFITTIALHLSKVHENMNAPLNVLLLCVHGGVHVLLIQLQGDSGSALVFLVIFIVMLFFAGISWKYIAAAVVLLVPLVLVVWFFIMTPDQQMRFRIVQNPELDSAYAYQQMQGKLALGVGGVQGTGIFSGRHVRVPEIYNDFIFSFIGEATGFMGCLGVIMLLTAICFKILYNSSLAADNTGRFVCVGVFAMMLAQTIMNVGMCIGVLPVIGVTLPLFSAGGTSVISLYLALGLVLSVYRHSSTGLFYNEVGAPKEVF